MASSSASAARATNMADMQWHEILAAINDAGQQTQEPVSAVQLRVLSAFEELQELVEDRATKTLREVFLAFKEMVYTKQEHKNFHQVQLTV